MKVAMMAKLDAVTAQIFVVIAERHESYLVLTDVSSGCKACNLNTRSVPKDLGILFLCST